jgi:hypothetical protein
MRTVLPALALVGPALAETPLSPEAFAAHVGTDTIRYAYSTGAVGTADYGPDGTLRWAFEGEPCFDGLWFARNDEICFAFSDGRLSACWHFFLNGTTLRGVSTERASGNPVPLEIREIARSAGPIGCAAPEVGV